MNLLSPHTCLGYFYHPCLTFKTAIIQVSLIVKSYVQDSGIKGIKTFFIVGKIMTR